LCEKDILNQYGIYKQALIVARLSLYQAKKKENTLGFCAEICCSFDLKVVALLLFFYPNEYVFGHRQPHPKSISKPFNIFHFFPDFYFLFK